MISTKFSNQMIELEFLYPEPRTESFLKHVLGITISANNTVMVGYTKNTGGGDIDDAAITIWQEREDAIF